MILPHAPGPEAIQNDHPKSGQKKSAASAAPNIGTEAAAPMLVVWLPHVIRFLFQALQIINLTWILHDGAVVGLGFWPKPQQQVCTFRIHGTLRYSSYPRGVLTFVICQIQKARRHISGKKKQKAQNPNPKVNHQTLIVFEIFMPNGLQIRSQRRKLRILALVKIGSCDFGKSFSFDI